MNKFLFLLVLFVIVIFLSGCPGTNPTCGDGICSFSEDNPNSPFYCPDDCGSPIVPDCADTGERVYINESFGPTYCCSEDDDIKPSIKRSGDLCLSNTDGSKGICVTGWNDNCGNGVCESDLSEDFCNCPDDCSASSELGLDVQIETTKTEYVVNEEVQIK